MRRSIIAPLTSNADDAAVETAAAALGPTDGLPVMSGAKVSLSISCASTHTLTSGGFIGFAYYPATINADGSVSAQRWARCKALDYTLQGGHRDEISGAFDVPAGAYRVIGLPKAIVDSGSATSYLCGVFQQAQSFLG